MTNSKYSFLKGLIVITSVSVVLLFVYVFTLEEIKTLRFQKQEAQDLLNQKNNGIEVLRVEVQKLSSEERITRIASEKLGLVRTADPLEAIKIDKEKIQRIEELVNSKYE